MILAELMTEAGVPAGAFQVLHGDKSAVDGLWSIQSEAISFVGSTPIAKYIYSRGAELGKRVQALGGAKNHRSSCQMPIWTKRLMPCGRRLWRSGRALYGNLSRRSSRGEGTANTLIEALAPRVRDLKIGNGMDAGVEMGPLICCSP